ncbi:MAG: hypothetical protein R3B47_12975 [Bacteroidia bacterium]
MVVELRDRLDPTHIVYSRAGLLLDNGAVVDMDGQSPTGHDSKSKWLVLCGYHTP